MSIKCPLGHTEIYYIQPGKEVYHGYFVGDEFEMSDMIGFDETGDPYFECDDCQGKKYTVDHIRKINADEEDDDQVED